MTPAMLGTFIAAALGEMQTDSDLEVGRWMDLRARLRIEEDGSVTVDHITLLYRGGGLQTYVLRPNRS